MIPSSDQDVDDVTLGKMLTEAHRGQVDYCEPEGTSVSQSSSSVMFDRSGQPDERNSSKAQIRTLLEEQRQTIIAEHREKVGHHELQAAHAEEERVGFDIWAGGRCLTSRPWKVACLYWSFAGTFGVSCWVSYCLG